MIGGLLLQCLYVKFDRHIRDIPGPFPASFSSIWKTWDTYEGCSQYTGEEDYLASPFPRRLKLLTTT